MTAFWVTALGKIGVSTLSGETAVVISLKMEERCSFRTLE